MVPAIHHGAFLLVKAATLYSVNDIVQVIHPQFGAIVKRIVWGDNVMGFYLGGDGEQSITHHQMGLIAPSQILGKVRYILNPP